MHGAAGGREASAQLPLAGSRPAHDQHDAGRRLPQQPIGRAEEAVEPQASVAVRVDVGQERCQRVVVRPLPHRFQEEAHAAEVEVRPAVVPLPRLLRELQEEVGERRDLAFAEGDGARAGGRRRRRRGTPPGIVAVANAVFLGVVGEEGGPY